MKMVKTNYFNHRFFSASTTLPEKDITKSEFSNEKRGYSEFRNEELMTLERQVWYSNT